MHMFVDTDCCVCDYSVQWHSLFCGTVQTRLFWIFLQLISIIVKTGDGPRYNEAIMICVMMSRDSDLSIYC